MPIFWLTISTIGSGRSLMSSPEHILSIDSAASWPCATAQMMFFGPNAASPPKNTLRMGRGHGRGIDLGHVPFVELDADVALDPGEGVLLADRDQHVVAGEMLIGLAGRHQLAAALGVVFGLHLLEHHAGEPAVLVGELLRDEEIEDRNVLVHGVLLLPGRRLHLLEAGAHDDLHVLAAEAARGAAAIHGGVAAAEHDHALADLVMWPKETLGEPVDADMNIGRGFLAAGNIEVATARRAGADEDRVPVFGQQRLQAVDALAAAKLDAEVEDVAAFLVDDGFGQAESGNLRADHAAGLADPDRTRRSGSRAARDRARP